MAGASSSTVVLSVSTSAIGSPSVTSSPTSFSHAVSVAEAIVSASSGRRTSIGIAREILVLRHD